MLKVSYVSCDILLFAQDFVIHAQLGTKLSNVPVNNLFVGSEAFFPSMNMSQTSTMVYKMIELTFCRILLLLLGGHVSGNGTIQRIQPAGKAHGLGA